MENQIKKGDGDRLPVEIKPSTIHGNGLFATRDLKRGEVYIFGVENMMTVGATNDAAIFQTSAKTNLREMKDDSFLKMEEYREKSLEGNNVRIVNDTTFLAV